MRLGVLGTVATAACVGLSFAQTPEGSSAPQATFGTTVVLPGGLRGTVYAIPKDATVLPDFVGDGVERIGEIWTSALNVPPRHWHSGFPGLTERFEWFAIDYTGRFWIDKPGRYTFALISDDGSRLFLDDTPVIDNDCLHPPDLRIAAVELGGGVHRIRVSYFQGPRDCLALVLAVAGPDQGWRVFTTEEFKPPSNPEEWAYPGTNSIAIVPTKPSEAGLSMSHLLQQVSDIEVPRRKAGKWDNGVCLVTPVRSCGK